MSLLKEFARDVKSTMGIYEPAESGPFGLLAEFRNPGVLLHAAERMHKEGYRFFDTHSPFPIHGMDRAMGLGQSKVGYIALGGGLGGLLTGYLMQWWMGGYDYPINVGGKPFFAIEPSIPIMFELTILLAALSTVAGMLALNGLPRLYNPLFYSRRFLRATDDGFFLHVSGTDKRFSVDGTRELLSDLGAVFVEEVYDNEVTEDRLSKKERARYESGEPIPVAHSAPTTR